MAPPPLWMRTPSIATALLLPLSVGLVAGRAVAQEPTSSVRVVVTGVSVLPVALVESTAQAALGTQRTDPTTRKKALDAVVQLYRARGFVLAQVTAYQLDPDGTFRFTIAEGHVRRVLVLGAKKTRIAVLSRAISAQPGTVYNENAAREDRLRLARLGIFSEVQLAPSPVTDSEELGLADITLKVKETETGTVAATVGYSDGTGLIGFVDLSETNVLGTAQRASFQWQRYGRVRLQNDGTFVQDQVRTAFNLTLEHPRLTAQGLAYGASVYDQNTVFLPTFGSNTETLRTYEQRKGGRGEVGRRLSANWSVFLTARHDRVGYDPNVPERLNPPSDLAQASAIVGAVGVALQSDQRDRTDNPRHGALSRVRYEDAGRVLGGNRRFTQTQLDLRRYAPLAVAKKPEAAFATRVLCGTSTGSVPLSEQFFLGGFDLLRGYDYFSVRGDRMALASAEARVPLGSDTSGVVFVDWGGAWLPGQPVAARGLKAGGGIGLRFQSPVGPIRFDLAYGDQVRTYVSLGQAF